MKRYDQYRIDVREGGTTDYKQRSEDPRDRRRQDDLFSRTMEANQERDQPIPPDLPEPAAAQDRHDELERERHVHRKRRARARKAKNKRRRG